MARRRHGNSVSAHDSGPMDGYGLKAMSIGFLVEEETPMI
jgi:hypothetical protein